MKKQSFGKKNVVNRNERFDSFNESKPTGGDQMTNQLQVQPQMQSYNQEDLKLLKDTVCKGASDAEFKLFMAVCQRAELDPFTKQIYAIKRWDQALGREALQTQTSIDGHRLIAERSGKYKGQVGPFWCGEDGQWKDVWLLPSPPHACKVGVLKEGYSEPTYGVAKYETFVQRKKDGTPLKQWKEMADLMLSIAAEKQALRKAFPLDTMRAERRIEEVPDYILKKAEEAKLMAHRIAEQADVATSKFKELQQAHTVIDVPIDTETGEVEEEEVLGAPGVIYEAKPEILSFVVHFGKYKNKTLGEIGVHDAKSYRDWLRSTAKKSNKALSQESEEFCRKVDEFEKVMLAPAVEKFNDCPMPTAKDLADIPF